MINGMLGKKIGMTQIFSDAMEIVPVTVIAAGPMAVLQVKTPEREGYRAVQVGFDEKRKNARKAELGHAKKAKTTPRKFVREFSVDDADDYKLGDAITVEILKDVKHVDVSGFSKGRGYTGTVKRHNFSRQPQTHGCKNLREPGSSGSNTYPGHVRKGKRMAGRWGNERCTVRNLEVVRIDKDENLLFVRGAVPGPYGGYVEIRRASR